MSFKTKCLKLFYPFGENKRNKKINKQELELTKPIYGFYHIFAFNDWEQVLKEQVEALENSGLAKLTSKLYVSIICENGNLSLIKEILKNLDYEIINITSKKEAYEFPALEAIIRLSQTEDFYCFYFHTKGTFYSPEALKQYECKDVRNLTQLRNNGRDWRKVMEYWCFFHHKLAIKTLNLGFDTYGCLLYDVNDELRYYTGNFWWANSSYLKNRPLLSTQEKAWRFSAETWLLRGTGKGYDAYRCNAEIYYTGLPESCYVKNQKSVKDCIKFYSKHISYLLFVLKSKLKSVSE